MEGAFAGEVALGEAEAASGKVSFEGSVLEEAASGGSLP